jgi:hypothetical protein
MPVRCFGDDFLTEAIRDCRSAKDFLSQGINVATLACIRPWDDRFSAVLAGA